MVKSMFAGVAGLKTHMSKLDVIGNNIANVNTYGYKKERAAFADTYYATSKTASEANGVQGGSNPTQIGYGVQMAGVNNIMTTGGNAITDNPTDVMITGNGFFLVGNYNKDGYTKSSSETGAGGMGSLTALSFTRVGIFNFDGQGNFVDGNANYVYGFSSVRGTKALFDTRTPADTGDVTADTTWTFKVPADADAGITEATYTVKPVMSVDGKSVTGYTVTAAAGAGGGAAGDTVVMNLKAGDFDPDEADALYLLPSQGDFTDPNLYKVDQNTGYVINIGSGTAVTSTDQLNTIQQPRKYSIDGYYDKDGKPLEVLFFNENDRVKVKAYTKDENGDLQEAQGDGITDGIMTLTGEQYWNSSIAVKMSNISVGSDGTVSGIYDEKLYTMGKIAVADVPNPTALENQGNNYYMARANTGVIDAVNPGEGSTGGLKGGTLELSNVDLSTEFTDMITTQRGFQANSRIITVTDSMLEELVNLKRS